MTLEELTEEIEESYTDFDDDLSVSLDRETRNELAVLETALEPEGRTNSFGGRSTCCFRRQSRRGRWIFTCVRVSTSPTTSISRDDVRRDDRR